MIASIKKLIRNAIRERGWDMIEPDWLARFVEREGLDLIIDAGRGDVSEILSGQGYAGTVLTLPAAAPPDTALKDRSFKRSFLVVARGIEGDVLERSTATLARCGAVQMEVPAESFRRAIVYMDSIGFELVIPVPVDIYKRDRATVSRWDCVFRARMPRL